jgi:hypothetical protein
MNNRIFSTLLYPYFGKMTLSKIFNPMIYEEIINYLNKCLIFTEGMVQRIEKDIVLMPLFDWDYPDDYLDWQYLNCEFDLGLTENPKIKKIDTKETIKVSANSKSVTIKLNDKKDTAVLTTHDNKTYEVPVELSDDIYSVRVRTSEYGRKSEAIEELVHNINYNLLTLAVAVIIRMTQDDFAGFTETSIPDYEVMSHDTKLMSLLDTTKKLFEERYQTLTQLRRRP